MRIQIGKRAKKLLLCICFALCSFVFLAALDFNRLLAGYAENDIELKELDVKLRRALLAEQKTVGENTVNLSLSTGTMTFTADGKNTSVSVSPEIKLTLPSLNNTEIKAEVPSSLQTADGSVSKSQLSQAGVSLSTDIVSSAKSVRNLANEKARRTTELARRALENRFLQVEKNFWTQLRALYTEAAAAAKLQDILLSSKKELASVQTQGYEKGSSRYRGAELKVKTDEHELEKKRRELANALADFALNCGLSASDISELPLVPDEAVHKPLLSVTDFDKDRYVKTEQAEWNSEYAEKARSAKKNFSLRGSAGYSYTGAAASTNGVNTLSAGLISSWKGVSAAAGVSVPVETPEKPKFNLSFGWDMNKHKSADFTRKDDVYAAELDGFSVQAAKKEADRQIRLFAVKADDLEWQRKKNAEELNLGKRLYEDTQKWYKDGIVSADDVLRAKTAYESILYKTNGTELDCLIYNIDLTLLFVNAGDSR